MNRHLTGVMAAVLTAAMLFPSPAFADHRPGNVVVMGGTLPLTGHFAVRGARTLNGRTLYVDEMNARGGLLGHKVELKTYDDKTDKRAAIELYEKLITEDKVDLVLGPYGSGFTDPVANVTERYKRPFVAQATNPVIWQRGRKYVFSGPATYAPDRPKGLLHIARKIGVERIAFITRASATGLSKLVGAQAWAKKLGLKIVLVLRYQTKQKDFRAHLRRVRASGAEAIISNGPFPAMVAQVRQLRELGINVKMFATLSGGGAHRPEFVEELGGLAEYVVGYTGWQPKPALGYPGIAEFIEKYEKRHGEKPTGHSSSGYAGMQITVAAVKAAGSFDPENIRDALASITVDTIKGTYKANEQGMSPIDAVAIQIQNGRRVLVWPEHAAEAKVLPMPKWEDRAKK